MEDFLTQRHRLIYGVMLELQESQVSIDLRTVQAKLEQRRPSRAPAGWRTSPAWTSTSRTSVASSTDVEIVKERSVRRRLIDVCRDITRDCLDGGVDAQKALDRAESAVMALGEEAVRRGFVPFDRIIEETLEMLEEHPGTALTGVPSGFVDYDRLTHGLGKGTLIIIGGRPGMGKTSLALNIASHVAIREKKTVGIFSLEMGSRSWRCASSAPRPMSFFRASGRGTCRSSSG